VEVSEIQTHQTEEIDPCRVALPESDDEVDCVENTLDLRELEVDEDVLPLSVAGRESVPEIAKVITKICHRVSGFLKPFSGPKAKSPTASRTVRSSRRLHRARSGSLDDSDAPNRG
jgi:hypothetical protein